MRLFCFIIENICKKVGNFLVILCCINSIDDVLGGIDVYDSLVIVVYLEDCGIDGFYVLCSIYIYDEYMWVFMILYVGFSVELVIEIKKVVSILVIIVGCYIEL